ncbi:MAG TPA: tyrosine-type recombinase/integrase, partial [Opitutaceae bacterium]
PAHLLEAIEAGSVSKNIFLRRLHNFALDMAWLPWPVLAKKRWPQIRFKEKRAVTWEEHSAIVAAENNPERRAYYECCWHLGAAQSDIANLTAEDIDWQSRVVSLCRQKTGTPCIIRFGAELEAILRALPQTGPLFPNHRTKRETHRAREFARACNRLSIAGITLHSYRYAWAERAKTCGYRERFAQETLGHNSKAVHRADARKAQVLIPALEDYERKAVPAAVIPIAAASA